MTMAKKKQEEPEVWTPKVGDIWHNACHPHTYQCELKNDGIHVQRIHGNTLVGDIYVVPDMDTLKLRDMGLSKLEPITE
jgi:hypothetical protein